MAIAIFDTKASGGPWLPVDLPNSTYAKCLNRTQIVVQTSSYGARTNYHTPNRIRPILCFENLSLLELPNAFY